MWSVVGQTSLWQSAQWVGFSAAWAAVRKPPEKTADSWPVTCWEDWWIDSTREEVTTRPDCRATCASLREHLSQFSRRSIRQCVRRLCARRVHHKKGDKKYPTTPRTTWPDPNYQTDRGVWTRWYAETWSEGCCHSRGHYGVLTAIWSEPPVSFERRRTASQTDDPTERTYGDQWTSAGGCKDDEPRLCTPDPAWHY